VDREGSSINRPQLFRAWVSVHQDLLRLRNIHECIPTSGSLPEARADSKKQITITNALSQCGIHAEPEVTNIQVVPIVEQILAAKTCCCRQLKIFGKFPDIAPCVLRPAAAAE
jgi:hypothetical protein